MKVKDRVELAVVVHLQPPAERERRQRSKEMGENSPAPGSSWASAHIVEGGKQIDCQHGGRGQSGNPLTIMVIPSEQHPARATLVDCYPSIHPPTTHPPAR